MRILRDDTAQKCAPTSLGERAHIAHPEGVDSPRAACPDLPMARSFFRRPSWRRSLAARTSPKLTLRRALGIHTPRGWGWLTNPKRAAYNRVYDRTSVSLWSVLRRLFRP